MIYDQEKNKWKKISDTQISEISEIEAFQLAQGGGVPNILEYNACAYYVTYLQQQKSSDQSSNTDLEKYIDSRNSFAVLESLISNIIIYF